MPTLSTEARRLAKANAQAAIDAASEALADGLIDRTAWHERVTCALAAAYLADDDPRWQSGFDGDATAWREARELILEAVSGDGTFLDVGCATGHLMECLAAWGLERGQHLAMYGLELNADLARAARRRLPAGADRIHVGNAVDWEPPMRFTYVRTGLEYVPAPRQTLLAARLLRDVVEPGGRLIIGPVPAADLANVLAVLDAAGRASPAVVQATDRGGKTRCVAYVERERTA
jgi:SAM-dependent methyltransferase